MGFSRLTPASNLEVSSLGVGTPASGTPGDLVAETPRSKVVGSSNSERFGYDALYNGGSYSTAVGNQALYNGGSFSAAVGFVALYNGGSYSTAVGSQALYGGGSNSTAVGNAAVFNGGSNCTAVGFDALYNGGSYSTAVGVSAGPTSPLNYTLSLGYKTEPGGAGSVCIGTDSLGNGATSFATDEFVLGTVNHLVQIPGHLQPTYSQPALPANPPVSGTVYQNTTGGTVKIIIPVTATAIGGSAQLALGPTNAPVVWGGAEQIGVSG